MALSAPNATDLVRFFEVSEGTSAWDFSPKSHKWRAKCSKGAVEAVLIGCAECELSKGGVRGFACCVVVAIFQSVAPHSAVSMLCVFAIGECGFANCAPAKTRRQDSLAEWSKALAPGASPQGRGLEPHSCQSCAWRVMSVRRSSHDVQLGTFSLRRAMMSYIYV